MPTASSASELAALRAAKDCLREGRAEKARHLLEEVVRAQAENLEALDLLAGIQVQSAQFEQALKTLSAAIAFAPSIAALHGNLGFVLTRLGKFDDALRSYNQALVYAPNSPDFHFSRAVVLDALKRWSDAIRGFDETLALKPGHVAALIARAAALEELQRHDDALASYDRAIRVEPRALPAHFNRSNLLFRLGRFDEALESVDCAMSIDSKRPEFHNNRGVLLGKLKKYDEALASFESAIRLDPSNVDALTNRGNVLNELGRSTDALASHDAALAGRPDYAQAHVNRGITLFDLGRAGDAVESYERAIARDPRLADAHFGKAVALEQLKRYEDALASYQRAVAIAPDLPFLFGKLLHQKAMLCDWSDWDADNARLVRSILDGKKASPPFPVLARIDDALVARRAAEIYANEFALLDSGRALGVRAGQGRIRLGYFSADFHDHATAHLTAELFERHDRARFEVFAFSFGPETGDAMRARLRGAFEHFIDIRAMPDLDVVKLARNCEIEIAIDLKGYTGGARPGLFARRLAPLQVNYLGFPGTLGAPWYDYLIADETLITPADRGYYAEKVVTLPESYQPNDSTRVSANDSLAREQAGLPKDAFVFCCFNNAYKITPHVFDKWMRILRAKDAAVLWLLKDDDAVENNLRNEASIRGVAPERLIFAPRISIARHLARHRLADLFLDTLPYNAHTTASDALSSGLPIITQKGATFAGRVAASLLNAAGLTELVVSSADDYVDLAVALVADPIKLLAIKQKLADRRRLSDMAQFTGRIERAFEMMHVRAKSGRPPDHISVK